MAALAAPVTVEQKEEAFRRGVSLVRSQWTALALAVDQLWGGPRTVELARELEQNIHAWFTRRNCKGM